MGWLALAALPRDPFSLCQAPIISKRETAAGVPDPDAPAPAAAAVRRFASARTCVVVCTPLVSPVCVSRAKAIVNSARTCVVVCTPSVACVREQGQGNSQ